MIETGVNKITLDKSRVCLIRVCSKITIERRTIMIGAATLSRAEKDEFLRRKNKLTSQQRECLNKICRNLSEEGSEAGMSTQQIAAKIGQFIKDHVLRGAEDYCAMYQNEIKGP
jgi:hypothetical protein